MNALNFFILGEVCKFKVNAHLNEDSVLCSTCTVIRDVSYFQCFFCEQKKSKTGPHVYMNRHTALQECVEKIKMSNKQKGIQM